VIHKTTRFDDRRTIVITDTPPARRSTTDDRHGYCFHVETTIFTDGTIEAGPPSATYGTIEQAERIATLCLAFHPAPLLVDRPAAPAPKPDHWHQHVCFHGCGLIDCLNPACFVTGSRLLADQIACPGCNEITGASFYFTEPRVNDHMPDDATARHDTPTPSVSTLAA